MKVSNSISCDAASELLSPFIDSMVSVEDADSLRAHLSECGRCHRELQSIVSLRTLLAGVEPVSVPEDLQLDTRVKLSHARSHDVRDMWRSRIDNILKPFAVPAVMGVMLTMLGFGLLLGSLNARGVVANADSRTVAVIYQQPQGTDSTMKRLRFSTPPSLDQAFSIQAEINDAGRMDDFSVIGGTRSQANDRWLQELVLLSQWRPATTYWGLPVRSRVILSFVTVRG
jgi:hypothetical protein